MVEVDQLRGGTAAFIEIAGASAGRQSLGLRAPDGGAPATTLRIAIVRLE